MSTSIRRRGGWCTTIHLREENARFLLLAVVMIIYMLAGAIVFHFLEAEEEVRHREHFQKHLDKFFAQYNESVVNRSDVYHLLYMYGNASSSGVINKRPRWDIPGSFYFVGTVVSTIGFGMTTPKTIPGRILVVFYGLLGCSGAILFFNLFLERIITLLAFILRSFHESELRRKGLADRRDSQASLDDHLDSWKPSVYWVMLCLFVTTIVLATCASGLYSFMENWSYFEALYFCFVTFATIGFGDLVSSQQPEYQNVEWYRLANFFIIVSGCCCIYSLFNVMSIIIKQFLNWLIKKLDCRCTLCLKKSKRQRQSSKSNVPSAGRRNALTLESLRHHHQQAAKTAPSKASEVELSEADSTYDSDGERRNSGELICMTDMMRTNKVSLALLQKELYESAQRGQSILLPPGYLENKKTESFKPGSVGPLAIVTQKLGDERS